MHGRSDCGARGARPSRLVSHPRPIPDSIVAFGAVLFEFLRVEGVKPYICPVGKWSRLFGLVLVWFSGWRAR